MSSIKQSQRILIQYWSGKFPPVNWIILNHNIKYFDHIFIFTDDETLKNNRTGKYTFLPITNQELITLTVGSELQSKLKDQCPSSLSDLVFYFGKRLLKSKGYQFDKVMYSDLEFVFFSQFSVNQLYSLEGDYLYCKYSRGRYIKNGYKDYISGDWSLDTKSEVEDEYLIKSLSKFILDSKPKYTLLGPTYLNSTAADLIVPLSLITDEVDPNINGRTFRIYQSENSLGIGYSNSFLRSIGLKVNKIKIHTNSIELFLNEIIE